MERKRKLPPRAAARVEQAAKRRTSTPPGDGNTTRSATPALSAVGADDATADSHPEPPLPKHLPRSIQPGKPLPTVEQAQAEDLPVLDYQSVNESGVLAESLQRSRQKWISEGIFDKYWSKPSKRRGIAVDDPKNPPKESMVKLGQVTITVEPHMFEATMYGIKDPKPAAALPPNGRPIIMYGPSRGAMPPPSSPTPAPTPIQPTKKLPQSLSATPGPVPSPLAQKPAAPPQPSHPSSHPSPASVSASAPLKLQPQGSSRPGPVTVQPAPAPLRPVPSPRGMESILSPSEQAASPILGGPPSPAPQQQLIRGPSAVLPSAAAGRPPSAPVAATAPTAPTAHTAARPANAPSPSPSSTSGSSTPRPAVVHPPGTDSIIVTLAERATEDVQLRDLMKRVANGNAPKEELDRFQNIIDQITAESKRNGAAQGPSADRLIVDGRTVRFFAEEVRIILDIVLRTNPKQTSADLRPPTGSDPLVVMLVKTALDDAKVRDMVRRIGEQRPRFSDATDLKAVLDRLKNQLAQDQSRSRSIQGQGQGQIQDREQQRSQSTTPATTPSTTVPSTLIHTGTGAAHGQVVLKPNGVANGTAAASTGHNHRHNSLSTHNSSSGPVHQALRSKGPPPAPKVDVSAVVFEFHGGTGDRYLFPRFSVLEYITNALGQPEVVASFLIVRKGSASEYGGDPDLDYYQPVTIRVQMLTAMTLMSAATASAPTPHPKILDYLSRVVAPVDEVRRYMDNIMSSMTRAEYVLLAMRLPRREMVTASDGRKVDDGGEDATDAAHANAEGHGTAGKPGGAGSVLAGSAPTPMQGVLWTSTAASLSGLASGTAGLPKQRAVKRIVDEDQQYQELIAGLTPRDVDD